MLDLATWASSKQRVAPLAWFPDSGHRRSSSWGFRAGTGCCGSGVTSPVSTQMVAHQLHAAGSTWKRAINSNHFIAEATSDEQGASHRDGYVEIPNES